MAELNNICNSFKGMCNDCMFNTTGHHCNECQIGFKGDAIKRTCVPVPVKDEHTSYLPSNSN